MYAACRGPYGSSIHRATQSWLSSDDGCCWWRRLLPKRPLERTTATAASPIHFPRRFTQPAAKLRGVSVFTGASRFPNRSVRPRERIGRRRCRLRHRFRGSTSHGFKPKHGRHHFPSGENDRRQPVSSCKPLRRSPELFQRKAGNQDGGRVSRVHGHPRSYRHDPWVTPDAHVTEVLKRATRPTVLHGRRCIRGIGSPPHRMPTDAR